LAFIETIIDHDGGTSTTLWHDQIEHVVGSRSLTAPGLRELAAYRLRRARAQHQALDVHVGKWLAAHQFEARGVADLGQRPAAADASQMAGSGFDAGAGLIAVRSRD
jgi:hypothetical protein